MEFLDEFLILITVKFLALASPGPDFVMAVRNAILYSRRAGILTALGFACGVLVHIFYSLVGIAAIISQSIVAFSIIKYAGAAYLIYIGIKGLRARKNTNFNVAEKTNNKNLSDIAAFRSGFITNLFNPKATMFFLALFTQIISTDTPLTIQLLYGATCFAMTFGWFSIVAVILTNPYLRARFIRVSHWIERTCGAILIALGLKIALTR